jgi:hypothetical protein
VSYVREAAWQDFFALSRTLRKADEQEVLALGYATPLKGLASCYFDSVGFRHAICKDDGTLVGLFGVMPTADPVVGAPWLLANDGLRSVSREFIRQCPQWIAKMHERFPVLSNVAYEHNSLHHRWLKWCGFTFIRRVDLNGHPFLEFVRLDRDAHLRIIPILEEEREDSRPAGC